MSSLVGDARVPRRSFELRLGDTAVQVWSYLCRLRDHFGTVTATVPGICRAKGFTKLKPRTAKRALARLREAGLVRDLGFVWKRQGSGTPIRVYVREVRGAWAGREHVLVPTDTWATVMRLKQFGAGRGGVRTGTGPKPRRVQNGPEESALKFGASLNTVSVQNGPVEDLFKTAPLSSSPLQVTKELVPSLRSGTPAAKQPAAGALQSFAEGAPAMAQKKAPKPKTAATANPTNGVPEGRKWPAPLFSPPGVGEGRPQTTRARLEALGAFSGPFPGITLPGLNGLPPHPTADETCSTLPPPPKVPTYEDLPEVKVRDAQLAFCAKWYRAAVESRVGRCHPIRMSGETRKYFEDALDVFLEHDIRPGAWVAWALDRILTKLPTNARRRFVPQTKMLLSPKTLTEGRWMFRESAGDYSVTALVPTRSGKEFGDRYRKLMLDVLGLPLRDRASIEPLVAAHFPEGASEARRVARENSMRVGQVVRERINEGRWVWQLPKALRE